MGDYVNFFVGNSMTSKLYWNSWFYYNLFRNYKRRENELHKLLKWTVYGLHMMTELQNNIVYGTDHLNNRQEYDKISPNWRYL